MLDDDPRVRHLIYTSWMRPISRREIIRRGLTAGLSLPAVAAILAACGSSSPGSSKSTGSAAASTTAASGSAASPGVTTSPAAVATGGTPINGGDFTILWDTSTSDLDPQSAYSFEASSAFFGTYEMLIQLKGHSTFDYAPMLAREWGPNSDGTEWSFTLYDNIKFHDGSACDAKAVVKSFQRFYKMGRGPFNDIVRFVADPDTDITAPDAKTVKFKLRTPNPIFEADIASQYGPFVVSPTAMEQHKTSADPYAHNWFSNNMVGTGPYKATQIDAQHQIVLERFPDYYRGWGGSHFNRIVIRVVEDNATRRSLMEGGSADALVNSLTPSDVTALKKNRKLQVVTYPSTNVDFTRFNSGDRLKDPTVRQGLSYAFPYNDIRQGVFQGLITRTGGPLTPTTAGYDPKVFIYDTDLTKAKQMIQAKIPSGTKFSGMIASGSQTSSAAAQLFQANLQQIGYGLDIRQVEGSALTSLEYGNAPASQRPDFFLAGIWWPDYNDGYNEIYPNFDSKSIGSAGSNSGWYKNARVDQILATLEPGVSKSKYNSLLAEAQNILTKQDPPAAWWGTVEWFTILQANIRNFVWNPIYLGTYYFYDMYRVKE